MLSEVILRQTLRIRAACVPCRQFSSKYRDSRKTVQYLELEGGEALYGIQPVSLCLRAARRTVHCLYYNPGSERAAALAEEGRQRGVKVVSLDRKGLDTICQHADRYKEHHVHQGVVADVSKLYYQPIDYVMPQVTQPPAAELSHGPGPPVWVLLCSVKDPGNLGSIIRTCYYLGVSRLIMTGARCQLSSVVSKSSAGTLEIFPVFSVRDCRHWVSRLLGEGWRVLAADIPDCSLDTEQETDHTAPSPPLRPSVSLDELQTSDLPTLLVLGSEGGGIPPELESAVPERVFISSSRAVDPAMDSLNVSVAAAIIIHRLCHHVRANTS